MERRSKKKYYHNKIFQGDFNNFLGTETKGRQIISERGFIDKKVLYLIIEIVLIDF